MKAIGHRQPAAARFPFAGRHRFVGDEEIVQPARSGQADLERGIEHAGGVPQQSARVVERERLQEGLGRNARPAAEQTMQIVGAHPGRCRDGLDLRLGAPVLGEERDGPAHDVVVCGSVAERLMIVNTIGREHGRLHGLLPPYAAVGEAATRFLRAKCLVEYRPRWSTLGLAERRREREREAFLLLRSEAARDRKPPPARNQEQPLDAELCMHHAVEPNPERIERPFADPAVVTDLTHGELGGRDGNLLVGSGAAVAHLERPIEQQHIEPAKAEHRPRAGEEKCRSQCEACSARYQHQREKALAAERAVRGEHGRKDRGVSGGIVVGDHGADYTGTMARKKPRRARRTARNAPRRTAQSLRRSRARTPAHVKSPAKRSAADHAAAAGALPQWTTAEIEEAFRRFQAASPEPKGELKHINPFTLLVAVVLSAQATDAGVNKATPALFAAADTPEKMAALAEERLQDLIKTIGLFRTKAKNLIALSKKIVHEHGGEVPRTREALEALPGVGRKTANVVLNVAFGEATIAVDTHIFRVGNRTGMATGKTPLEVERKLDRVVPAKYKRLAHHWLILHGRYVCLARRPLCEKCLIADLCKWPGKTVLDRSASEH